MLRANTNALPPAAEGITRSSLTGAEPAGSRGGATFEPAPAEAAPAAGNEGGFVLSAGLSCIAGVTCGKPESPAGGTAKTGDGRS